MANRVVNGFVVRTFTVKEDKIKVILGAKKDDLRAGDGGIVDILESLELHATAADTSDISMALRVSTEGTTSRPFEFTVTSFTVKQDDIKVILETGKSTEEGEEEGNSGEMVRALAIHSAGGDTMPVELTMARVG